MRRPPSIERVQAEHDIVKAMLDDGASYGAHYHVLLGMEWALKWVLAKNATPSHTVRSLTTGDDARYLAEAHDALLRRIDQTMATRACDLFVDDDGEATV